MWTAQSTRSMFMKPTGRVFPSRTNVPRGRMIPLVGFREVERPRQSQEPTLRQPMASLPDRLKLQMSADPGESVAARSFACLRVHSRLSVVFGGFSNQSFGTQQTGVSAVPFVGSHCCLSKPMLAASATLSTLPFVRVPI